MLRSNPLAASCLSISSAASRTFWRVVSRKSRESAGVIVRSRSLKAVCRVCLAAVETGRRRRDIVASEYRWRTH